MPPPPPPPPPISTGIGKSLLGAALAGISLAASDAAAAVVVEGTDFSSNFGSPSDLSLSFGDFLTNHEIQGAVTGAAGSDYVDYIKVAVTPSAAATISFTATTLGADYFGMFAFNSSGGVLASKYTDLISSGTVYQDSLTFTTPADGIVVFMANVESGSSVVSYTIGTVPEPTSAVLGAAGLAAIALRRRRDGE